MAEQPFRVGVWCDYKFSIAPDEGIGVLVYNLVQGFLALDEAVDVVLLVKPGDQERVASLTGRHDRLRIATQLDGKLPWRLRVGGFLKAAVTWLDRLLARETSSKAYWVRQRDRVQRKVLQGLSSMARQMVSRNILAMIGAVLLLILLPLIAAFVWVGYAVFKYLAATLQILAFPGRIINRGVRRLSRLFPSNPTLESVARQLACDVWIIPQVLVDHSLPFPSVVLIHDFASSHFPEQFERWFPGYHERACRLMPLRAKEAAICLCMSNFIRDNDLLGVLKLPPAKVRVVRSAPPADLPALDVSPSSLIPSSLRRPFLFYPTAFRPYKNHGGLIEALRILRDRYGVDTWDLVFTGEKAGFLLPELRRQVQEAELQDRVHVLGRVDRQMLAALYRCAYATLVPSLYEQGSFQIYEAIQAGCPVACSRIPSLLEQCGPMGENMLYFDPADPDSLARTILAIQDDREGIRRRQGQASPVLWTRNWRDVARDFLQVCKQATPRHVPDRLEAFVFLQIAYAGGVWEATKDLLRALADINRQRQELTLTVAVHEDQADTSGLEQVGPELRLERFRLDEIPPEDAAWILRQAGRDPSGRLESKYVFPKGCENAALSADAWFALVDRFSQPLLPARPYGVLVYDLIQRHLPHAFAPEFFQWMRAGMRPTVGNARTVLVTSPATRADVIAEYQVDPSRIQLVSVACEPHRRFAPLTPEPVTLPREPFILCVANASEHKGADVLLRAYARMKTKNRVNLPLLVFAGLRTDALSPRYRGDLDFSWWVKVRKLVRDLELEEGRDMVFLGLVNDRQLLDLYQRCAVVVNPAKYDNGSFTMIEGAYFGRPVISSQYPAAEYMAERFGISVKYFPVDDHHALALALEQSFGEKPVQGVELERIRQRLRDPELSYRRYAERVYDVLLELAKQGRKERVMKAESRPVEAPLHSAA